MLQPEVGALVALVPRAYCSVPPVTEPFVISACALPLYTSPFSSSGAVGATLALMMLTAVHITPESMWFLSPFSLYHTK